MSRLSRSLWIVWLTVAASAPCVLVLADDSVGAAPVDFAHQIRPILATHCQECHGPKRQEGGLRLNLRDAALAGGDSGQKALVPGDPAASRLVKVVDGSDGELTMPPQDEGAPLEAAQIDLLKRWISEGAAWPAEPENSPVAATHWAWQKPIKAPLPAVHGEDWPRQAIDFFVLAGIEQAGLAPAPEADRYTLVRRVYLDLTGLPPSPAEVDSFLNDTRPEAYERMVQRALDSPAYGERWARVWLDLARYADSKGYGSDPLRTIWRYRDWVIEAFNGNLPFDQFTIEQLAGDLLPNPTPDQILATAFHRNTMANDEGGTDDEEFRVAAVKDRIETTMQVWMGITMGCAKCHSHKFDPITQREYYQAYAFFNQTEDADRGDEEPKAVTPTPQQQQQIADRRAQIVAIERQLATPPGNLEAEVAQWEQSVRAQASTWVVLEPQTATATDGANLQKMPDHSLLAVGANPEHATYHVDVATDLQGITAFRLEALPDESLPQNGPGRTSGNFVLNELRISAAPHPPSPVPGRFLRIEIPGEKKILSLAEVQIFQGSENVAPQGQAKQSSTSAEGSAELAIDGRTDGIFGNKSVTHSNEETDPWWELDFGRSRPLERVVIWNRTDQDTEIRLKDFRVSVLDENRQVLWQRAIAQPPLPSLQLDLTAPPELALGEATADFSQQGWAVSKAIDGDPLAQSGWAISPQFGKPHYAIFQSKTPVSLGGPTTLLGFTLVQSYGGQHTLGRFRFSATTAPLPPKALPQHVHDILAVAPEQRSAEQRSELTRYYWGQLPAGEALHGQIARLETQIMEIEKQIPSTPIMRELPADKGRVTHTMIKGNFQSPGEPVSAAAPAAFHRLPDGAAANRLGLAHWLMDKENPLTARVTVNRFWAQLFGAGIVPTEEDFGTQGLPPTNPELLDWLAVEFRENGWDMKDLLRQIVCSATYRQVSNVSAEALPVDPSNRLLARGPRFRLEAEMVRDQALAISGLLSRKQGGPSVYPPQPPGLWRAAFNAERTWATSDGEDRYRRGLYTYWRRTVPYPSMAAFDAPSREICTIRRVATNTPLQAFVMLNDPVYVEAAQALARRIVAQSPATPQDRAGFALRLALVRPPAPAQIEQLVTLYHDEFEHYKADQQAAVQMATEPLGPLPPGADAAELAAWTVVANVILNLDGVLAKR